MHPKDRYRQNGKNTVDPVQEQSHLALQNLGFLQCVKFVKNY